MDPSTEKFETLSEPDLVPNTNEDSNIDYHKEIHLEPNESFSTQQSKIKKGCIIH